MLVDRPLYLTADGTLCEADDPAAVALLADTGTYVTSADVEHWGLTQKHGRVVLAEKTKPAKKK